jgi:hypothetical protein
MPDGPPFRAWSNSEFRDSLRRGVLECVAGVEEEMVGGDAASNRQDVA